MSNAAAASHPSSVAAAAMEAPALQDSGVSASSVVDAGTNEAAEFGREAEATREAATSNSRGIANTEDSIRLSGVNQPFANDQDHRQQ